MKKQIMVGCISPLFLSGCIVCKERSTASGIKERTIIAREDRYEKYANGVVFDKRTGFEWMTGPDIDITWDEARLVCFLNGGNGIWANRFTSLTSRRLQCVTEIKNNLT